MTDEAAARQLVAFVEKLVDQTSFGNIQWVAQDTATYVFAGSKAKVVLRSVDGDGLLPLALEIFDAEGDRSRVWIVDFNRNEEDTWFDDKIMRLWEMVHVGDDTIASLIEDLDALPPF